MASRRFVIDTGILISAALAEQGTPNQAVCAAIDSGTLIFSADTLAELVRVFNYEKFDRFVSRERRAQMLLAFGTVSDIVVVSEMVRECEDPNDDMILEAALAGHADCIIASDKKLSKMHPFRGIPIVSPADFLHNIVKSP